MNIERLEQALAVMQDIADSEQPYVNMMSVGEPQCGTPGCHAGLWWLTLKQLGVEVNDYYSFLGVARTVFEWLGVPYKDLQDYYALNPIFDYWPYGVILARGMFANPNAFGTDDYEIPSQVIVDTWREVLENYKEHQNER